MALPTLCRLELCQPKRRWCFVSIPTNAAAATVCALLSGKKGFIRLTKQNKQRKRCLFPSTYPVRGNLPTPPIAEEYPAPTGVMVGAKLNRTHVPQPLHTRLVGLKTVLRGRAICRQTGGTRGASYFICPSITCLIGLTSSTGQLLIMVSPCLL